MLDCSRKEAEKSWIENKQWRLCVYKWKKPVSAPVSICGLLRPFGSFPFTFFHDQGLQIKATSWNRSTLRSTFQTLTALSMTWSSYQNEDPGSLGLKWALRFCISNQLQVIPMWLFLDLGHASVHHAVHPFISSEALKHHITVFWFTFLAYKPCHLMLVGLHDCCHIPSWGVMFLSFCLIAQSCPTLCSLMDGSLPGSSVHGILQARILQWVPIPFSRGSSLPRDWIQVSCIAGKFFTTEPPGKPLFV